MTKKYSLIRLGQEMLASLDQTLVDAQALRENLRSSLEYYANDAEPSPQSEARLRADLMLAQDVAPRQGVASCRSRNGTGFWRLGERSCRSIRNRRALAGSRAHYCSCRQLEVVAGGLIDNKHRPTTHGMNPALMESE